MCWMCGASADGPLSFADCSPTAPWRAARRTHESYVGELEAEGKSIVEKKSVAMNADKVSG